MQDDEVGELSIRKADSLRRGGHFSEATGIYERILDREPNNHHCLKSLLVINLDQANFKKALYYSEKFKDGRTLTAADLNLVAVVYQINDNSIKALEFYNKSLEIEPKNLEALFNRAIIHRISGRFEEAILDLNSYLEINPDDYQVRKELIISYFLNKNFENVSQEVENLIGNSNDSDFLYNILGAVELEKNNYSKAISIFENLVKNNPNFVDAYFNLANCYFFQNDFERAKEKYFAVLKLQSQHVEALIKLGIIFKKLKDFDSALSYFQKCLEIEPAHLIAMSNLANIFHDLGQYEKAHEFFDETLKINPDYFDTYINRGKLNFDQKKIEKSLSDLNYAIKLRPHDFVGYLNRGVVKEKSGDIDGALLDYDLADKLNPNDLTARWNDALCRILIGDYFTGWKKFESRFDVADFQQVGFPYIQLEKYHFNRLLKRDQIQGKSVLIFSEQGIGDEIMFASILPDLLSDAANVTMYAESRLLTLFRESFPQIKFFNRDEIAEKLVKQADLRIAIGSLGYTYRRAASDFKGRPYLNANNDKVEKWRERLPKNKKLIGISWRGGIKATNQSGRSANLMDFYPLISRDDLEFVSLQFGDVRSEIEQFNSENNKKLIAFNPEDTWDISNLVALIANMDAVVTVQNTNVHLCGALGKRCLALLPQVPEWRYGRSGKKLDWYSSVDLFRRTQNDTWSELVSMVSAEID